MTQEGTGKFMNKFNDALDRILLAAAILVVLWVIAVGIHAIIQIESIDFTQVFKGML
jgi:hypothetical protein